MDIIEKDLQTMEYLKIYGANAVAFFVTNFTILSASEYIDVILKICVAVPTIIYTILKIATIIKNDFRKNDDDKK